MRYYADLHIHSRYSRATSQACDIPSLAAWAGLKGIQLVATGDFTHPRWFSHLRDCLVEAQAGLFRLRDDLPLEYSSCPPGTMGRPSDVRFILSTEISSIYKRGGRTRKVHNLIYVPDFASASRLNSRLAAIGNIEADGRPILGLDSKNLLEILLKEAPEGFLVPAHIWTPWFSLFGSKSGFDSIEDCFGDLTPHIFALETGLSSDPAMNRLVSSLDRFSLISNSDCHSPAKLGREANLFDTELDYFAMRDAIRTPWQNGQQRFLATVEFFPEEGKYHCDGHRKCGLCCEPAETRAWNGICPRCGAPLTVGVLSRVSELADRKEPRPPPHSPEVHHLIPLQEVLGELLRQGPETGRVQQLLGRLLTTLGPELNILRELPLEELRRGGSELLEEAIRRLRQGRVRRQPGYDGEYGIIRLFDDAELAKAAGQLALFAPQLRSPARRKSLITPADIPKTPVAHPPRSHSSTLNPEQAAAVASSARHILVQAGPGTGKTHTLVARLRRILAESTDPCTVITFTNRAADELRNRLTPDGDDDPRLFVGTFHGFCLRWLRRANTLQVAGPEQRRWFFHRLRPKMTTKELEELSRGLQNWYLRGSGTSSPSEFTQNQAILYREYDATLAADGIIDLDEIVPRLTAVLWEDGSASREIRRGTGTLAVDEFQDVSPAQYALVRTLAITSPLFAIGDPDQSIYAFRGSDPTCFFRCQQDIQPETHSLLWNYRCGRIIMEAAAHLVAHTPLGHDLQRPRAAEANPSGRILRHTARDGGAEAEFVVQAIETLLGGSSHRQIDRIGRQAENYIGREYSFRDFAVLYRMGWQSEMVAEKLVRAGLPYQTLDVTPFFLTGQARQLHDYLLTLAFPKEFQRYLELVSRMPGVSSGGIRQLELTLPLTGPDFFAACATANLTMPSSLTSALNDLSDTLRSLRDDIGRRGIADALKRLAGRLRIDITREEIRRLLETASAFNMSLDAFAGHLLRTADSVVYDEHAETVTLSTLHAAKGLEFEVVFLLGLEEGILPHMRQAEELTEQHLAEERRLLYVGMTRARACLYLLDAARRFRHGTWRTQTLSRFLQEVPSWLLNKAGAAPSTAGRHKARQRTLF